VEQKNEKLLLSIPGKDARALKELISSGEYSTKSEALRAALKAFLYERSAGEERRRLKRLDRFFEEVDAKVKEKGYTRKDLDRMLEEAKEETRKEVRRMLAEAKRKRK